MTTTEKSTLSYQMTLDDKLALVLRYLGKLEGGDRFDRWLLITKNIVADKAEINRVNFAEYAIKMFNLQAEEAESKLKAKIKADEKRLALIQSISGQNKKAE